MGAEDLKRLSDVRTLVAQVCIIAIKHIFVNICNMLSLQLYEALHVGEYHLHKEHELVKKIENLKFEISPLEMVSTFTIHVRK